MAHGIAGNGIRSLPVSVIHGRHPTAIVADAASQADYPASVRVHASDTRVFIDSDADVFPMTGLQRLNSRASMFQYRFGQQGATE